MSSEKDLQQVSDSDLSKADGGAYLNQDKQVVNTNSDGLLGSSAPTIVGKDGHGVPHPPMMGSNGHGVNPMVDKAGNPWGDNSMGDIYIKNPETGELNIYKKEGEN